MIDIDNQAHGRDIRPSVARPSAGRGMALFVVVMVGLGGGFFYALQINRANLVDKERAVLLADAESGTISSPPELAIPYAPLAPPAYFSGMREVAGSIPGNRLLLRRPSAFAIGNTFTASQAPRTTYVQQPTASPPAPNPYVNSDAQGGVVFQAPILPSPSSRSAATAPTKTDDTKVAATRLSNPSATVPQGSVIHAVMETALDSTRPGFARAIVSHDVMSFDGTQVLIPKGSKLFGEYKADLSLGEKRALIQWHRLTRPDGVIIDVDSPAADPLGRAGLKGKVNTHFFERFGGVILQSVLNLGVRAATREANGDTIVLGGLPPAVQGSIVQQPGEVRPTLKVKQGKSITVFVGRDLDFSSLD